MQGRQLLQRLILLAASAPRGQTQALRLPRVQRRGGEALPACGGFFAVYSRALAWRARALRRASGGRELRAMIYILLLRASL